MKLYILAILLLTNVISIKKKDPYFFRYKYSSAIIKIAVEKALQVKTTEEDYIEKISKLDIPQKVKEWVKNLNASNTNTQSNIDITYNTTLGGYAKGDSYYFRKIRNEYTFKYGTADVILGPLKPTKKRRCIQLMVKRKKKNFCWYEDIYPLYDKKKFKDYVINRINIEIQDKIYKKYKPSKINKTKKN